MRGWSRFPPHQTSQDPLNGTTGWRGAGPRVGAPAEPPPLLPQFYNGTLKREADSRRFSSYSQMESWGRQYPRGSCTAPGAGSDICFMQKIKASRSEPDLYCDPRGTLRKGTLGSKGHKTTQNRYSFYSTCSGQKAVKKYPGRPPSCTSKQDPVCVPPTSCAKDLSFSHSRASSK